MMLEHERERYRDLFELAPDPYIVTDRRGVIREANRAAGMGINCVGELDRNFDERQADEQAEHRK